MTVGGSLRPMRIRRAVDLTIGLNLLVILLGATVRATGSGAGCGRSWPSCQGELVPALEGATAIEFTHRAFSGIALLAVAVLVVMAFRAFPSGSSSRKAAIVVGISIVIEALIGMVIVLAEWVADDASVARAVSVPIHLVSTFVLLGGLVATRFFVSHPDVRLTRLEGSHRGWLLGVGFGMVVIAATGAVTALADTLFPKEFDLGTAVTSGEHFLTRLRIIHPIIAVVVGLIAARYAATRLEGSGRRPAVLVLVCVGLAVVLGSVNVGLGTPLVVSLLHLLVADVMWMAWVALGLETAASGNPSDVAAVAIGPERS